MSGPLVTMLAVALAGTIWWLAIMSRALGYKPGVLRAFRNGQLVADPSGVTFTALDDYAWIARFGPAWRDRYPTTWACGYGRDCVWWYTPKEKPHADRL